MRISKEEYYLNIAAEVAKRSSCIRRQYGAVIVKDDRIISTGYNGSPRGQVNCCDLGSCSRNASGATHGDTYGSDCPAVHAEQNAIIHASPGDMIGATLYLAGWEDGKRIEHPIPCFLCARMIANAQIKNVIPE
ncbi:MAG TPA: dCMP deaminase family protein [Saprospiraceae bacterium]|nr:dCMP deaminase family protein [Saprospiraceae bacterium]